MKINTSTTSRTVERCCRVSRQSAPRRLQYYGKLNHFGGAGAQFTEFIGAAEKLFGWQGDIVACGRHHIHPALMERLPESAGLHYEKYVGSMKLPNWPRFIRVVRQRHLFRASSADAVLIWNEFGHGGLTALKAVGPDKCVYWERGTAWVSGESSSKKRFINRISAILTNSIAAKRMLELRWGYSGQVEVVHNALRPSVAPVAAARPRQAPLGRIRLGFAGRLVPLKGVVIALHAVAVMIGRGHDVALDIAGEGVDKPALIELTRRLGITESVRFLGLVLDMEQFYADIDLLIHPALQECFGTIATEANAHGVPAIVTAVDGLVEAVSDGINGICVRPMEPLSYYTKLGGDATGLPPYVYHPAEDTIDVPRIVAPDALADAVIAVMADGPRYEALSRSGIDRVFREFGFDRYVSRAVNAIDNYLASGELVAESGCST